MEPIQPGHYTAPRKCTAILVGPPQSIGVQMEFSDCTVNLPADPREVVRASCVRVGAVPPLFKGQEVWALNGPFWYVAIVGTRLPGGVYRAQFDGMSKRDGYVIICANVFGGLVDEVAI